MESSKKILRKENRQLIWIFGIIALCFIVFLGAYYYNQSQKKFEHSGINWRVEDYDGLIIYHGRVTSFANENVTYNMYLRNDPRTNNATVEGSLTYFKLGGFISFTPSADACRGDVARVMVDLASYLTQGIGMRAVEPATTDGDVFRETGRVFADCSVVNREVIIIQKGNESSIKQDSKNPYCYTITVKDCEDIEPVEKFITESVRQIKERQKVEGLSS